jgi:hypothetical protein
MAISREEQLKILGRMKDSDIDYRKAMLKALALLAEG